MESPFLFDPGRPVTVLGRIYGTPLAVQGYTWLPLNELIFWMIFTARSVKKHAGWQGWRHLLFGGLQMTVLLGSEWCHNIAHAAMARAVGKPVDGMRLIFGMPVLLYLEPEHSLITPRQHILRSLGGPALNMALLLVSELFRRITPAGSPAREVADVAVGMNTFISFGALVPVPVFDGGPIFKWSLISRGFSPQRAGQVIARANKLIGAGLAGAALLSARKRRRTPALAFSFLGALCLAAGYGLMKDQISRT